jgi:NAD(P)-dependent dehydrogenase (short-subunit alcohol dehydrogenase family)
MKKQQQSQVWLITGTSSGFGKSLAEAALEAGHTVVATARNTASLVSLQRQFGDNLLVAKLDVTNEDQIQQAVAQTIAAYGTIDVLVNNAGYGLLGALEEVSSTELRRQFEANFFGAARLIQEVLPHMRRQGGGHIINFSSEGGMMGVPGASAYNASKFALEGLSEALALEVAHLGIKVTIVEPGAFRTNFSGSSLKMAERVMDDYSPSSGKIRWLVPSFDGKQPGDPRKAAKAVLQVVNHPNPPLRLILGADALEHITAKLNKVNEDIRNWQEVTLDTAIEEPAMD